MDEWMAAWMDGWRGSLNQSAARGFALIVDWPALARHRWLAAILHCFLRPCMLVLVLRRNRAWARMRPRGEETRGQQPQM